MIYFLIPVYNESLNIEDLRNELTSILPEMEKFFLFVDDCSKDDTPQIIKNHFDESNCHVITKEINKGPGDSFNLGFEWILENSKNDSDTIVTIEGDNTSDVSILKNMIAISNLGYDIVLASVYAQGGSLSKTTFFRKALSFFANLIMRFLLNLNILTLSSFYRVYKKSIIQDIKKNYNTIITELGFLCKVEILIKAVRVGASVIEVPTSLRVDKRKAKSKMRIFRTFKDYLRLMMNSRKFH